jgi:ATPase
VENKVIPRLIGKEGKTIKSLENKLGVSIDVQPMVESIGNQAEFRVNETGGYVVLSFHNKLARKNANVYLDGEYLFSATVGISGQIKISKNSDLGRSLLTAIMGKKDIKVFV